MNQLSIPVGNAAALVQAGYTTIEVWSSPRLPAPLCFEEITAAAAAPATLTSAEALNTFNMGGFSLEFSINGGATQTVDFGSILTNWTPLQVANQINTVVAGLASVVGSTVVLTSPTTGRASTLKIILSTSPNLGFCTGQYAIGKDARLPLVAKQVIYPYNDLGGMNRDIYQWRFSANGVQPISDFTPWPPVEGLPPALSTLNTVLAVAQFANLSGRPVRAKIVIAFDSAPKQFLGGLPQPMPAFPTPSVGSSIVSKTFESDETGYLQVQLVQGIQIRVAIEGTAYVREIKVPTGQAPTFNLLAAMAKAPDPFDIQYPLPYLIRQHI